MQGNLLYEYAVIRVVPKVEREEFINVGLILYCSKAKFLKAEIALNPGRLVAIDPELDIDFVSRNLEAFARISEGTCQFSAIAKLDLPSRFRWLTATRSTVIQCSKVHPGFCEDPSTTLKKLLGELVL